MKSKNHKEKKEQSKHPQRDFQSIMMKSSSRKQKRKNNKAKFLLYKLQLPQVEQKTGNK